LEPKGLDEEIESGESKLDQ
jgi:hypothetical protein